MKLLERRPVRPVTLPKLIEVGVTPTSEALLAELAAQYPASARGSRLKLVGDSAWAAAEGAAPPELAPPAEELCPGPEPPPLPPPEDPMPRLESVVGVPAACVPLPEAPPFVPLPGATWAAGK